jgi:hypothetical protein
MKWEPIPWSLFFRRRNDKGSMFLSDNPTDEGMGVNCSNRS